MSAPLGVGVGVGFGVGVGLGVGVGVGVLPLPVETPPQPLSNIANATAERRGMNLKRINQGPIASDQMLWRERMLAWAGKRLESRGFQIM